MTEEQQLLNRLDLLFKEREKLLMLERENKQLITQVNARLDQIAKNKKHGK
jgi:hypothetical protein